MSVWHSNLTKGDQLGWHVLIRFIDNSVGVYFLDHSAVFGTGRAKAVTDETKTYCCLLFVLNVMMMMMMMTMSRSLQHGLRSAEAKYAPAIRSRRFSGRGGQDIDKSLACSQLIDSSTHCTRPVRRVILESGHLDA